MSSNTTQSQSAAEAAPGIAPAAIEASCRWPLFLLFGGGALWLLVASVFGLIASIKFHSPGFLADFDWLTYGRVRPAYLNSVFYGFCLQAGLGVGLWLFARLGSTRLLLPGLVIGGTGFLNLGVAGGVAGILAGDATGFPNLDMPLHAAVLIVIGYILIGISAVTTFHVRRQRPLFVSQWFFFTALFWFAWIFTTAVLLLLAFPVRGVVQAVIAWWFFDNFQVVWLGLTGLAAVLFFVPALTNRPLHSYYLAVLTYWMLVLFGGWGGVPGRAPVPAWLPALSTVATVLTVMPLITVGLNLWRTVEGRISELFRGDVLRFFGVGVIAFILAGAMRVLGALLEPGQALSFSWFAVATAHLNFYGFFAFTMFGAVYAILPRLTGLEFPWPAMVRAHFWLALAGVLLLCLPLAAGGLVQAFRLQNANIAFVDVMKGTLPFLRIATIGDLLLAVGNAVLLLNGAGIVARAVRVRVSSAYESATESLWPTEVKS